jgi:hypothetical protein
VINDESSKTRRATRNGVCIISVTHTSTYMCHLVSCINFQ